jgi:hypothetical protein
MLSVNPTAILTTLLAQDHELKDVDRVVDLAAYMALRLQTQIETKNADQMEEILWPKENDDATYDGTV